MQFFKNLLTSVFLDTVLQRIVTEREKKFWREYFMNVNPLETAIAKSQWFQHVSSIFCIEISLVRKQLQIYYSV